MQQEILEQPILIFSTYCKYSINLLETLKNEYSVLYDSMIRMNIDVNPETGERPKIFYKIQSLIKKQVDKVPCLILTNGRLLTDDFIYQWIEMSQLQTHTQVQAPGQNVTREPSGSQTGPSVGPSGPVGFGGFGGFGDNFASATFSGPGGGGGSEGMVTGYGTGSTGSKKESEKKADIDAKFKKMLEERKMIDSQLSSTGQQRF